MKKFMIIAAAAATLLAAGCSKNEIVQNVTDQATPVSFGVYVPKAATKATNGTQTTTTLQTDGFGVLAFYTNDGVYSASATPNFMYNTQVTKPAASWTYSPVKYWPNEHGSAAASAAVDKVSFFAYAPYEAVTTLATGDTDVDEGIVSLTGNAATGDPKVTFQIPAKGEDQIDLLWGVAASDFATATAQVDPANAFTAGLPFLNLMKQECDGTVKLDFKHALAKLDLKVQAIVDDDTEATLPVAAGTKVFVRKVEIIGKFVTKSTLNLNNTVANVPLWETPITTSDGATPAFVFNDGKSDADDLTAEASESADIAAAFVNGAGVTNSAQNLLVDGHQILFIPTDLSDTENANHGFKVRVTYDVETTDSNLAGYLTDGTTHGSKVKNVITTVNKAYVNFQGGKIYTITLKLGLTSVKMDAAVSDWTNADPVSVNLPLNVD